MHTYGEKGRGREWGRMAKGLTGRGGGERRVLD